MKDTSAAAVDVAAGDGNKPWNSIGGAGSHVFVRRVMQIIMFLVGFAVLWMFLYNSAYPFGFPAISHYFVADSTQVSLSLSLFQIVFFFLQLELVANRVGLQLGFWVFDFCCDAHFSCEPIKKLNFLILGFFILFFMFLFFF